MVDLQAFKNAADRFVKPERPSTVTTSTAPITFSPILPPRRQKGRGQRSCRGPDEAVRNVGGAAQIRGDLEISPVYTKGKLAEIKVRVKNVRAGHNLPTSLTNVRQMWLEITAKDEQGKVVMTSGALKSDGTLPENTRIFNSDGMGNDFHLAVDPWVVTAFSRHDTIPPRGYKDVYYGVKFRRASRS